MKKKYPIQEKVGTSLKNTKRKKNNNKKITTSLTNTLITFFYMAQAIKASLSIIEEPPLLKTL